MLRDVFYFNKKPNVHPREKHADSLEDARQQATTEHFWIINEFCDYQGFDWDFDFEFLPDEDVWAEDHNNVWPSQHQKDSGTWLCPKEYSDIIIYRQDVNPIYRRNEKHDAWVLLEPINEDKFDFSWHPDPSSPPYIYRWGCKYFPAELKHYVEYHVEGATDVKYMDTIVELLPEKDRWVEHQKIDREYFDLSWRPDPREPPFIYVWGNKWISGELKPTLEYHAPGATDKKYMPNLLEVLPEWDKWEIIEPIDKSTFDFTWRPDPREPDLIYVFGNKQYDGNTMPTIEYRMPNATEKKYVNDDNFKPSLLSDPSKFEHLEDCGGIDYTWRPNPASPPYIYAWGNQWNKPEDKISIQYVVEGATEYKYMEERATRKPCKDNWIIPDNIDDSEFDYSWEPNPNDPPYIYQFGTQWQKTGGPRYVVDGATEIKYINVENSKAKRLPDPNAFSIIDGIVKDFDCSWHPDDTEEPYIYRFGNNLYPAEIMPTVEYQVEGAKEIKYINDVVAILGENKENWEIPNNIDEDKFDFSWIPDPKEPPFVYQFGTQWQQTGGPKYIVPGATQVKYVDTDTLKATALPVSDGNWHVLNDYEIADFDYSWHPEETEEPYIYRFGTTQYPAEKMSVIEYRVPGAEQIKYVNNNPAKLKPDMDKWEIPENIDKDKFDFSWIPDPDEPPFIYQFGTQWQKTGGPKYTVPGAEDIKYVDDVKATATPSFKNWVIPEDVDTSIFDFSWHPDETADPAIYQFGSMAGKSDGPRYEVPNNDGNVLYLQNVELDINAPKHVPKYYIETTLEDLIEQHKNEVFWALNKDLDYSEFDFNWRPDVYQSNYIHAFGSKDNINTQTYFVNAVLWMQGEQEINFIELDTDIKADLDMFFIDRGNPEAKERFETLKKQYPKLHKTRYLNTWVDTINRCANKSSTKLFWVLNSELDYTEFEFDYYPNAWQMKMVHVFGTQWSHWGTTFMINKEHFSNDTKYVKIIEHLQNLNFVKSKKAIASQCLYDVVMIDHGNPEIDDVKETIQEKIGSRSIFTVKYKKDYLTTLKQAINELPDKKEHYVWLCSSICDYKDFDFSYICDPFAKDQLHVFPSNTQKFGDTFFVDVNKAREALKDIILLDEFDKINYNSSMKAKRLPEPVISTDQDTLISLVGKINDWPYATLTTKESKDIDISTEPMSLWSEDTKNIIVTATGGSRIVVPKEAKDYVEREIYDYPYIKKSKSISMSNPMDIVFLSNGESIAEENWEHLQKVTKNIKNRVVRVDGVKGRVAAYHAALEASNTPWAFTVFAKLKVNENFDWNWQPDRMQVPKHYIFLAKNPVNGLVYGHQAMIAYNKNLTLENKGSGLDFTLDDEHEVVDMLSGTAIYNTDPFSTWRTAFREVIKLRLEDSAISNERLEAWLNNAEGDYAEFSIKGALDASKYYEEVNGEFDKLKLSYEWDWLKERFDKS